MIMTKDEAFRILDIYSNWNTGQQSISGNPLEREVFAERLKTITMAYRVIRGEEPQVQG
jgi:hypothetical protein